MRRALTLAARAADETNPNPLVGCVIVRGGRIVGEGYHRRAGQPHAERIALAAAGARATGATAYVTLEPCAHHGRTPPCTPPLIAAGLRRVVVAHRDPNPRVHGRGLAALRAAGIEVICDVLADEARALNRRYCTAMTHRRPFVTLKVAQTLDGRIATADGASKWITSTAQRREARRLRRAHDAVLVGIGTVLHDDPLLLPTPRVRRPFVRIVLDTHWRTPPQGRLVRSVSERTPVWIVGAAGQARRRQRLERRGVVTILAPLKQQRISIDRLIAALWRRGIVSVMVEGGSEVLGAFLLKRLFDEVHLFRAPRLLGGRGSVPAFGGPNPRRIEDAVRLVPACPSSSDALHEIWRRG
jgi:diaminohydroxyphosphoribosylaminopyrimidine deaminase/5-amino-6-(5-phosphoribosylamino)uracil reductase